MLEPSDWDITVIYIYLHMKYTGIGHESKNTNDVTTNIKIYWVFPQKRPLLSTHMTDYTARYCYIYQVAQQIVVGAAAQWYVSHMVDNDVFGHIAGTIENDKFSRPAIYFL